MNDEDYAAVEPVIAKAANSVWFRFKEWTEYDDVYQEIWSYYLENRCTLDGLLLGASGGKYIARSRLYSAGSQYCRKEMAYYLGHDFDDQLGYSKAEIRGLVRLWFGGGVDVNTSSPRNMIGLVDVQRAMRHLDVKDMEALNVAYGLEERDPLRETDRTRAARAVRRLQRVLSGG